MIFDTMSWPGCANHLLKAVVGVRVGLLDHRGAPELGIQLHASPAQPELATRKPEPRPLPSITNVYKKCV